MLVRFDYALLSNIPIARNVLRRPVLSLRAALFYRSTCLLLFYAYEVDLL